MVGRLKPIDKMRAIEKTELKKIIQYDKNYWLRRWIREQKIKYLNKLLKVPNGSYKKCVISGRLIK